MKHTYSDEQLTHRASAGNMGPGISGHGDWLLVILLLKACNTTTEQLENMLTLGGVHHQRSWWGLELIWPIASPPFLSFKSSTIFSKVLWQFYNRENKAFDLACAGSRYKQKSQGTLTQKLHCAVWSPWHCPYCVSPPTSVQSSSQRLTKYRCR